MKTKQKTKKNKHVTEEALLEAISIISRKLAYTFRFGYHQIEDMQQQISIFAIEGLEKYDHTRPLENFLWTHVRNRLFNFKRDNYQRPDKPCNTCPFFIKNCANSDMDCSSYTDKLSCDLYSSWYARNNVKKNLMYFNTIEDLKEYIPSSSGKHQSAEMKELIDILDEFLIDEYREIYIKVKHGNKIYKHELNKLAVKIREIIDE